jgi:hypothetical protein
MQQDDGIEKPANFHLLEQAPVYNPWDPLTELAARLGVKPCEKQKLGTITATGRHNETYDLWEVVTALLDRMDAHAKDHA